MDIGLPVLARQNDGNAALLQHGRTGIIFSTPTVSLSSFCIIHMQDIYLVAKGSDSCGRFLSQSEQASGCGRTCLITRVWLVCSSLFFFFPFESSFLWSTFFFFCLTGICSWGSVTFAKPHISTAVSWRCKTVRESKTQLAGRKCDIFSNRSWDVGDWWGQLTLCWCVRWVFKPLS